MGQQVTPAPRTPVDAPTLFEELGRSYIRLFQQYATREWCLTFIGQCYTECGDGGHNCWAFNLGNVQASPSGPYNYVTLGGAWEIVNGVRVNQAEHFRAFASLDEGCDQHVSFVHQHYPEAFVSAISGDCAGFAHNLKMRGYFSADEHAYAAGVSTFFHKYASLPTSLWETEMQAAAAAQPIVTDTGS
jgi:hypothetical protein